MLVYISRRRLLPRTAERRSRVSQRVPKSHCDRVRAAEHAPRRPSRVLERIHGLAEIVKCGLVVVVELSPAPRRRSVDSRQRFETTRPSSRRLRALRRRPRHGPHPHRSPRPRLPTATVHTTPRPRVRCSIVSFARAPGLQPSEPTGSAALFLGNETALCPRARQRFVADGCCARVLVVSDLSSTIKLVELAFCYDRVKCSVMEPI